MALVGAPAPILLSSDSGADTISNNDTVVLTLLVTVTHQCWHYQPQCQWHSVQWQWCWHYQQQWYSSADTTSDSDSADTISQNASDTVSSDSGADTTSDSDTVALTPAVTVTHLVVSSWHSEDVSSHRPAQMPDDVVELVQKFWRPVLTGATHINGPDEHLTVLQQHRHTTGTPDTPTSALSHQMNTWQSYSSTDKLEDHLTLLHQHCHTR